MAGIDAKRIHSSGIGPDDWISLSKTGSPHYSVNVIFTGITGGLVDIEGTLEDPDTGPTGDDVFKILDAVGINGTTQISISNTPLSGIRINQTAGTGGSVTWHVKQMDQ